MGRKEEALGPELEQIIFHVCMSMCNYNALIKTLKIKILKKNMQNQKKATKKL